MSERPENYEEELQRLDDKQKLSPMRFQFDRERILTIFADNDEDGYRELFGSNWSNLDFRGLLSELKTKTKN